MYKVFMKNWSEVQLFRTLRADELAALRRHFTATPHPSRPQFCYVQCNSWSRIADILGSSAFDLSRYMELDPETITR